MTNEQLEHTEQPYGSVLAESHDASWFWTPVTVASVLAGLALALIMSAGMFWIGNYYVGQPAADAVAAKPTLEELRADDQRKLDTYGWVDRQQGVVRIPVERAMQVLAQEAKRKTVIATENSQE